MSRLSLLLVVALLGVSCVVASRDFAAATSAEWPADLGAPLAIKPLATELSRRHFEFLEAVSASGSSASSTGVAQPMAPPQNATVTAFLAANDGDVHAAALAMQAAFQAALGSPSTGAITVVIEGIAYVLTQEDVDRLNALDSTPSRRLLSVRRRLLAYAVGQTVWKFVITLVPAANTETAVADTTNLATSLKEQFNCGADTNCVTSTATDKATFSIRQGDVVQQMTDSYGSDFNAVLDTSIAGAAESQDAALGSDGPSKGPNSSVPSGLSDKDGRSTNGGYYFLGAVDVVFMVAAGVFAFVHKAPASEDHKYNTDLAPAHQAHVDVVPGGDSGVAVVNDEQASLGASAQGQMDYRSVFALRHNVLEKKSAEEEDDAHSGDVHFILHQ